MSMELTCKYVFSHKTLWWTNVWEETMQCLSHCHCFFPWNLILQNKLQKDAGHPSGPSCLEQFWMHFAEPEYLGFWLCWKMAPATGMWCLRVVSNTSLGNSLPEFTSWIYHLPSECFSPDYLSPLCHSFLNWEVVVLIILSSQGWCED